MIKEKTICRINPELPIKWNFEMEEVSEKEKPRYKPLNIWFQTEFKSDKGKISLIHLGNQEIYGEYVWEICCLEGYLFEDVLRFDNLIQAIHNIERFLE